MAKPRYAQFLASVVALEKWLDCFGLIARFDDCDYRYLTVLTPVV